MKRVSALLLLLCCLLAAGSALAFTDLKGSVLTEDEKVYEAQSFRNLKYSFRCVYEGLERHIPMEQIASIEHTGSKNLGGSAIFTLKQSVEKALVTLKEGKVLEVELPPGFHPFEVLTDGSEGKLYFTIYDTISGANREVGIPYDTIVKLTLR